MKGMMNTLSVSAIGLLAIAVLYQPLPKAYKTALLFGGVASAGLMCFKLEDFAYELKEEAKEQAFYEEMEGINDRVLSMQIAAHEAQQEVLQEYVTMGQLRAKFYNTLPYHEAKAACERFGIFDPQPEQAVNTTATPVQAPQVVQTVPRQETESSVVHQPSTNTPYVDLKSRVQAQPKQVDLIIPEEDIAKLYAECTTSTDLISNLLITAEPGCGKSYFVCALMHLILQANNGEADFTIIAGKDPEPDKDPGYCGFEFKGEEDYIRGFSIKSAEKVAARQETLQALCEGVANPYPTITINDEWNNTRKALESYDDIYKPKPKTLVLTDNLKGMRLTQGRTRRVIDIDTSHSPYVDDIGINRKYQNAYQRIIFGRGNKTSEISKSFTAGLIGDQKKADELKALWLDYYNNAHQHNYVMVKGKPVAVPIALTNIGTGVWRLVRVPNYTSFAAPIHNPGITNQSGDDLIDAIYEDEEPVETPEEKPVPDERLTTKEGQQAVFEQLKKSIPSEYLLESREEGVKLIKEFISDFFWKRCEMKYPDEQLTRLSMYLYDTLTENGN